MRTFALALAGLAMLGVTAYGAVESAPARSVKLSRVDGPVEGPGGVLVVDDATLARFPAPARAGFDEATRAGHAAFTLTRSEAARLDRVLADAAAAQGLAAVGYYDVEGRVFRMARLVD